MARKKATPVNNLLDFTSVHKECESNTKVIRKIKFSHSGMQKILLSSKIEISMATNHTGAYVELQETYGLSGSPASKVVYQLVFYDVGSIDDLIHHLKACKGYLLEQTYAQVNQRMKELICSNDEVKEYIQLENNETSLIAIMKENGYTIRSLRRSHI